MKRIAITLGAIASWALVSACGNIAPGPNKIYKASSVGGSYQSDSNVDSDPAFHCGGSKQIAPDYDRYLDGSGYYTACPSKSDYFEFKLRGQTHASDTVCVIPAEYISQNNVVLKKSPAGNSIWAQCQQVDPNSDQEGLVMKFEGVVFNSLFIVEQQHLDQMLYCLPGGNYFQCPPYSFGKFR